MSIAREGLVGTTSDTLRETVLRALTRCLPPEALVVCDGGGRPDLVIADRVHGFMAIDIDLSNADPADRRPVTALNREIADLRLEAPVTERFRPHRLVVFAVCPSSLLPQSPDEQPRALGLADVESGAWLSRLVPRPVGQADLDDSSRRTLAPVLTFTAQTRRGLRDPARDARHRARVVLDAQQAAAATIPLGMMCF